MLWLTGLWLHVNISGRNPAAKASHDGAFTRILRLPSNTLVCGWPTLPRGRGRCGDACSAPSPNSLPNCPNSQSSQSQKRPTPKCAGRYRPFVDLFTLLSKRSNSLDRSTSNATMRFSHLATNFWHSSNCTPAGMPGCHFCLLQSILKGLHFWIISVSQCLKSCLPERADLVWRSMNTDLWSSRR